MNPICAKLKHEIREIIPPTLFFFVAFQLIAFTRDLMLQEYGVHASTVAAAAIKALIVAKVVVVVDLLPVMNRFAGKPLIYSVLFKASTYFLATLLLRYLEIFIPLVVKHGDFFLSNRHLFDELVWPRFWYLLIWLAVLFILYSLIRELIRVLGREQMLRMFFGLSGSQSK